MQRDRDGEELRELVRSKTTETKLNLANCHLTKCPIWFPLTLRQVHLKNNCLTSLPGCIFTDLPNLVWLDVRNNELTELPPDIQQADKLEDLLLGGNFLKRLPACLAKLKKLNGLQLQPNKHLTSPPIEIVQQGFEVIIEYLRQQVDPIIEPEKDEEKESEKAASSSSSKTSLSSFQMPKLNMGTSQTKVMKLSLRNPMTEKELAAAMEKHLLEDKLPLRDRKFESLSDKEKFDRQAEQEMIQRDVQKHNDQIELENFRKKSAVMKSSRSEPGADSKEMSKILSHEEERSSAEISRQTPTKTKSLTSPFHTDLPF
ncbi:Oidioi.mRNA.OKI2018_I69.PAR.g10128.t1.cds [Oikopleura dioica]|uniref:Oidioi.mRNA.OKI2018_I69.PAR.g10128.t1.cds n=1 Tax=Oikopleura dioica TaxID=34765 RepID=A0ABN7RTA9_OIKDI|nr:Oidioi.mRNA.OKI2018_I69.PAR.g10128.t1.cds [Oikopleura dioica]